MSNTAEHNSLPNEVVTDLLQSDQYCSLVGRLGRFTARHQVEGAFAVYNNPDSAELTPSALLAPTYEQRIERAREHFSMLQYDVGENPGHSISVVDLIYDDEADRRTDVALLIHSHPGGPGYLAPSVHDLDNDLKQIAVNPRFIGGVVVASTAEQKVQSLLWRARNPEDFQPSYVQALDEGDTTRLQTLKAMELAGFSIALVEHDLKTGQLLTDPDSLRDF